MALDGSSSFIARLRPRSMVHQHAIPAHRHHHWHHHHHHRHHHWHQHHHHHGAGWSTNMKSLFIACLWWGQWCFHIWWWRQERSSWCVEFIQPPYTPIREYMGVKPPNLAQWLFFFHLQCGSLAWAHWPWESVYNMYLYIDSNVLSTKVLQKCLLVPDIADPQVPKLDKA